MPQPNQGTPAPGAPTAEPLHDKSGAMDDMDTHTGVHTPGIGGSRGSFK